MRSLPDDPFAFQARVMDALLGDIRDTESTTFARLDALRQVSQLNREARAAEKAAGHNSDGN